MVSQLALGKIYIFTGPGKGKTTAALGLAVRIAAGRKRVAMVQFLKGGGYTGELFSATQLTPYFTIKQFGFGCPIGAQIKTGEALCSKCGQCFRENRDPANDFASQALAYATEMLAANIDMLVLDEVSHAIRHKLIDLAAVLDLIISRPPHVSVVLTGRNMPPELIELADEACECQVVKHPMHNGIDARRGIEY